MKPWDIFSWNFPDAGIHPAVILGIKSPGEPARLERVPCVRIAQIVMDHLAHGRSADECVATSRICGRPKPMPPWHIISIINRNWTPRLKLKRARLATTGLQPSRQPFMIALRARLDKTGT